MRTKGKNTLNARIGSFKTLEEVIKRPNSSGGFAIVAIFEVHLVNEIMHENLAKKKYVGFRFLLIKT